MNKRPARPPRPTHPALATHPTDPTRQALPMPQAPRAFLAPIAALTPMTALSPKPQKPQTTPKAPIFPIAPRTRHTRHTSIPRFVLAALLALLAAAPLLNGCAVALPYKKPQVDMPLAWKELPGWTQAQGAELAPKGRWWTLFEDPLLNELEPQVAVSNQSVAQSWANYKAAMAQLSAARAGLAPTLGLSASAQRNRSNVGGSRVSVINGAALEGNASWTPDLWGGVGQQIEQGAAQVQVSEANLANATLAQQSALASAVINLRMTDASIDLMVQTVDAWKKYLRVVENKDRIGVGAPSDLALARSQLQSAQANLIALGVSRAQYEHAIALLTGRTAAQVSVPHSGVRPALPQPPVGVPSTLLERRADIAAAERQMAAANAAIGVAQAAYYPSLTLSASGGFSQSPIAGLLNIGNYVWSLGASAIQSLFDGGARQAQMNLSRANYDSAVASYRLTVLTALEQVENDLASVRILADQSKALDGAAADARRGAEIAQNEYDAGTVDYTTVANALMQLLTAEQSRLNVASEQLQSALSLITDLGGGWSGLGQDGPRKTEEPADRGKPKPAAAPTPSAPSAPSTQPASSTPES